MIHEILIVLTQTVTLVTGIFGAVKIWREVAKEKFQKGKSRTKTQPSKTR